MNHTIKNPKKLTENHNSSPIGKKMPMKGIRLRILVFNSFNYCLVLLFQPFEAFRATNRRNDPFHFLRFFMGLLEEQPLALRPVNELKQYHAAACGEEKR